jgi:Protein of unknwon function (DUF3310).
MAKKSKLDNNPVDSPAHYTSHPSGIEAIEICGYMNFCLGNALKYILRADYKGKAIEDLQKAKWYIDREIFQRTKLANQPKK